MPGQVCGLAVLQEPGARRTGVEHGFLGGEGLGGDDEERGLGIAAGKHLFQVMAIDIGNKVGAQAWVRVGAQGGAHHLRAQEGAADADIDDVGDLASAVAAPGTAAHALGECTDVLEHRMNL